ncbi:MAG: LLM class F420-dependent oxidoreductase [Actinomycetota bacterium]|nr:LLM class F420-dependent oxidoreductase [Actinomycetota bacterium]
MKLGVYIFPTDKTIRPDELGRAVEERGFESLWFPEHSHIPTSRATPWGGQADAPPLPEMYWRTYDQFVALMAAAAATTKLKVGSGITLVAQRDPIWLAKQVASVDTLSNGRMLFGIGYGWNKEELAHHGVNYTERRALLREKVLMMKELWTKDEASYQGEMLTLESSWAWPKPVQKPHPPIIMGGAAGPKTFAHIAEFCDGWMPLYGRHPITEKLGEMRAAAEARGRDPATLEVGVFNAPRDPERLEELAEAGVTRALFSLPSVNPDVVLEKLDKYAGLLDLV